MMEEIDGVLIQIWNAILMKLMELVCFALIELGPLIIIVFYLPFIMLMNIMTLEIFFGQMLVN